MSHSLLLIMVFLKLLQYQEILTLEVKTLIKDLLNILLKSLKRNTTLTLRKIFVLSKSSSPRQRKQREISHQYFKLRFKLRVLLMVSISMRQSQELALKNFVQTFSRRPLFQSRLFLMIHLSRNLKLMKSFLLVVQHVFQKSSNLLRTSSMAKNQTEVLTPTRLLPMVLPYRVVFQVVNLPKKLRALFSLILHPSLLVLKQLEVS